MAKINNFFGSYYRKSKEDQSSMWWKAEKIQESVLGIVKDCDSSEETLRRKISKEALKFQKQKLDVFNQKIDMLLKIRSMHSKSSVSVPVDENELP